VSFEVIERKAEAVALQKKLELKDELTKELATKAERKACQALLYWVMGVDIDNRCALSCPVC